MAIAGLSSLAPAQDVLLHEVRADAGERWIELHNRGTNAVDLSTWSLHHATRTASMPQNYWWGFPAGTTIAAGGFLRVHWYQPAPASAPAGELFTGNTPYHFLFGLGGEPLDGQRGALGLLRSQQNAQMNTAAIVEDWVSWGDHGFPREGLAVLVGRWTSGRHAPALPIGHSLARNTGAVGLLGSHEQEWFDDPTPTPLQANTSGMQVLTYGQACALPGHHLLGLPQLRARSLPLLGNEQFGFAVDNTTGVFGESLLFAFSAAAAPVGLPSLLPTIPGASCTEAIDTRTMLATLLLPTQPVHTDVALSLAGLSPSMAGLELHSQALVFDWLPNAWPPYQGITNALRVVIGQ